MISTLLDGFPICSLAANVLLVQRPATNCSSSIVERRDSGLVQVVAEQLNTCSGNRSRDKIIKRGVVVDDEVVLWLVWSTLVMGQFLVDLVEWTSSREEPNFAEFLVKQPLPYSRRCSPRPLPPSNISQELNIASTFAATSGMLDGGHRLLQQSSKHRVLRIAQRMHGDWWSISSSHSSTRSRGSLHRVPWTASTKGPEVCIAHLEVQAAGKGAEVCTSHLLKRKRPQKERKVIHRPATNDPSLLFIALSSCLLILSLRFLKSSARGSN